MHFVGMLALMLPMEMAYHVPTVVVSLFAAIAASYIGLSAASRPNLSKTRTGIAGAFMGGGIATMHYVGMAAMRMPARWHWQPGLVVLSIALAIVISFIAIGLIFQMKGHEEQRYRRLAGVLLMGLAIPTMHYTGMAAVRFTPSAETINLENSVSLTSLGISEFALGSILVLGLILLLVVMDRRLSAQDLLLRNVERRNSQLVESIQAILWQRNCTSMQFTFVNRNCEILLGFPLSEWQANPQFLEDHSHPDDRQLVQFFCRQAIELLKPVEFEHRFLRADGRPVWLRTYLQAAESLQGSVEMTGVAHDIGATKLLQNELLEQRRYFEALMNSTPDYIYFKDAKSRFVQINRAMALLFKLNAPEEAVGRTDRDFFEESHASAALALEQKIMQSGEPILDLEEREEWPDGRISWVRTSKMPMYNADGEIVGTLGISRDITRKKLMEISLAERTRELTEANASLKLEMEERRNLESQLLQAQKLESIGQLAAGVAHEINTPVQYVSDNCRFLSESFLTLQEVLAGYNELLESVKPTGLLPVAVERLEKKIHESDLEFLADEIPKAIHQSVDGLERVAQIVRAMKEFAHPGLDEKAPTDLNRAIGNTLAVCRNEYKYVAQLETAFEPDLPPVYCLVGEINQAVLNLVVNAAHAISDAKRGAGEGLIRVSTARAGDLVEIRISDNGTGIPDAIRNKVFDPFFTTKEVGRGSGQGLALARHTIVKKHHGSLNFETVENGGTTFILRIPISGQPG
jgi:PAS domain S-box-containing protein